MAITLFGYQKDATQRVVSRINRAVPAFIEDGDRTAVSLTAPTGSGKTIIAAAVIEQLLFGGEGQAANDRLVVLWVSDSPSLNEQTRDKFLKFSPKFTFDRLVIVGEDDSLDTPSLEAGKVYFLNTQKLGTAASSFRPGDSRTYDLWDTIDGTSRVSTTDFVVFVDEAHRGTGRPMAGAQTILGQLLKGGEKLPNPAPIVVGISATPERFEGLVGGDLAKLPVKVDVELVRESGLVKDEVMLAHLGEKQAADSTFLALAAHKRQEMARHWREYSEVEGAPLVDPILMVQVPPGTSEDQIGRYIDRLFDADTSLRDVHVVHALQEHGRLTTFGRHSVQWIEPSRIQETFGIKVVLFKEALTTGWDCPRAEVLVSLRGADDDTYITQLIGRMVRTPLAERIETVDELNHCWVYLPHFDEETVERVVGRLKSGDDAIASGITVNPVMLEPNPDVPNDVWETFADFPTNTKPARTARNDVDRAISLGLLLNGHGVQGVGQAAVQKTVVDTLVSFMDRDDVRPFIAERVTDFESIDFTTLALNWMTGEIVERVEGSMHVSASNVVDLFNAAKRKLPESSAQWLWDRLCDERFPEDPDTARLYVAAVSFHPDAVSTVEGAARALFMSWNRKYRAALLGDPEDSARATELLAQSRESEPATVLRPDKSATSRAERWWDRHLLAAKPDQVDDEEMGTTYPARMYPVDFKSSWERRTLEVELGRPGVVAWYRNPPGGTQAIGVPRGRVGEQQMVYPDFVVFRRISDGSVAVDIVDPHRPDLEDTIPKWHALAQWAARVNAGEFDVEATERRAATRHRFGRVWAIIDDDDELLHVDLLNPIIREEFARLAASGGRQADVRALFAAHGATLQ